MTESSSRALFYLPIIYFCTGAGSADMLASLAPPVHLSGDRLGWTLLVCMVSDFRRGRLKVSWSSASHGLISSAAYRASVSRRSPGHGAVAAITVVTRDWPSYRCSVGRGRGHHVRSTVSDKGEESWPEEDETDGVNIWTNIVTLLALRLLLIKLLAFNTLMTLAAVLP